MSTRPPTFMADSADNINRGSVEIIQDKLYFISSEQAPRSTDEAFYFNAD